MSYHVVLTSQAAREFEALRGEMAKALDEAITALAGDPRPHGCLKLTASQDWRIRIRDYRIRYRIDDSAHQVTVTHIAHRSKAY